MSRIACLLVALSTAANADGLELPVVEKVFSNGLKVLVLEDHDIPNVALYVTWRVGSRNEVPGTTGLAHYFEHMMFMGGRKYGKNFDPVMEAAGGSNNAYTTRDVTVYQDWFPAARLELILDLEADRMSGMSFDPKMVESERGVVLSEHQLAMEEPASVMGEQLWAAAYTAHPYQWGVLGWKVDIENWKQRDLEDFFRRNYAPNNATMVLVGAVKPERVFALVRRKIGRIPRQPERRPVHTLEPPQKGERRVSVAHEGARVSQVMMAWHMVATHHPDFAVFDVLENTLLVGESSRLHHLLVEEKSACLDVGGGWMGYQFDPSLFVIECEMRNGVPTAKAEELVYAELARIGKEGLDARALQRAKNHMKMAILREMKTIDGKASLISETETFFGGWRKLPDRIRRIDSVTSEDVQRIIGQYFRPTNRTVCTLEVN
ncbi:MAG: M16 family metallopeptidase [Planctomycetota bacterium]|jgi:zinc protease